MVVHINWPISIVTVYTSYVTIFCVFTLLFTVVKWKVNLMVLTLITLIVIITVRNNIINSN